MADRGFDRGKRFSKYEYEKGFSPTANKRDVPGAWGINVQTNGKNNILRISFHFDYFWF